METKSLTHLCEICGENEWKVQYCNGDGRLHHHGAIHTKGGGLKRVCNKCANEDAKKWAQARTA